MYSSSVSTRRSSDAAAVTEVTPRTIPPGGGEAIDTLGGIAWLSSA